jgi:hypothetical protein
MPPESAEILIAALTYLPLVFIYAVIRSIKVSDSFRFSLGTLCLLSASIVFGFAAIYAHKGIKELNCAVERQVIDFDGPGKNETPHVGNHASQKQTSSDMIAPMTNDARAKIESETTNTRDGGCIAKSRLDGIYFSVITWSSLGYGDVAPTKSLRLYSSLEALYGLVIMGLLIAILGTGVTRAWAPIIADQRSSNAKAQGNPVRVN